MRLLNLLGKIYTYELLDHLCFYLYHLRQYQYHLSSMSISSIAIKRSSRGVGGQGCIFKGKHLRARWLACYLGSQLAPFNTKATTSQSRHLLFAADAGWPCDGDAEENGDDPTQNW